MLPSKYRTPVPFPRLIHVTATYHQDNAQLTGSPLPLLTYPSTHYIFLPYAPLAAAKPLTRKPPPPTTSLSPAPSRSQCSSRNACLCKYICSGPTETSMRVHAWHHRLRHCLIGRLAAEFKTDESETSPSRIKLPKHCTVALVINTTGNRVTYPQQCPAYVLRPHRLLSFWPILHFIFSKSINVSGKRIRRLRRPCHQQSRVLTVT